MIEQFLAIFQTPKISKEFFRVFLPNANCITPHMNAIQKTTKITCVSKCGSWVYGFYNLSFWACDEDFAPDRTKRLLSGDGRAVFERVLHGEPQGIRVASYRLQVINYEGCL